MDVLTALGHQFRIQRFISIPNYQLPGESWMHLVARVIPFGIITGIALTDVVDMFLFKGPQLDDMTNVPFLVSRFDMIVIKLGVVFVAILSCCINSKHLRALRTINEYDGRIRKYQEHHIKQPIEFPKAKRSNIEFFLIFLVNAILVLNLHLLTAMNFPFKQALFHVFYALLMCIHDYVLIYISNIIRLFGCHEVQLEQILQDDISRHNQEVFSLVTGFVSSLNELNRALGSLTFFTFIHHLIGSCMSTYLLFWLIFVCPPFDMRIPFILSSSAYNVRMISYIIHMSIVGETIPKKIEKLRSLIRRWMQDEELCSSRENWVSGSRLEDNEKNFMRAVKFNTHQLLLRCLHQGTGISASEYFSINNSAIYATFGAVITYLMVLIQFQQLEEAKAQEGQDLI